MTEPPELNEFHQRLAEAQGLNLYRKYTEQEAAKTLDMSVVSLRRMRNAGEIECVRISPRKICFFGYQLIQCLVNSVESQPCPDIIPTNRSRLATSGCQKEQKVMRGTERGSIARLDKRDALASAHRILMRQSKH
jgi:hypothetical protein